MMTRRTAIKTTLLATAAVTTAGLPTVSAQTPAGPFTLPPLPYAYDALEPHIDAQTMQIHHDKHHAGYVNNLNKAVAGTPFADKAVEDILKDASHVPENIRTAVMNNGGGHANHSMFWLSMKKGGGGQPSGELAKAIDTDFGSFDKFKEGFTKAASTVFGSGWAWLVLNGKKLELQSTPNQNTPLTGPSMDPALAKRYGLVSATRVPLLGLDVWEHAYYLKYQNRRPEYIAAFFNVIDWDAVTERYKKASA